MPKRVVKTVTLLALATLSALALAADPPSRVGRVSLAQGQVSIGGDVGAEMNAAQVNWPVTTGNMISTAPGARTELRIGSTAIRLDGESSLEVLELDDDSMRLRLHYGSASIRVTNPDVLRGLEIETPQARVRLQQPGRVRIDAERVRDTSFVTVFDGAALVEGGGSQLTVRAGKRAELGDDDVRTLAAGRDAFDDWSAARDRVQDGASSVRYVSSEMTGYEDLDRYGSWRTDSEYGPVWIPTVSSTWVPYRDGSWTWLEPWGWTWVDNAPWGYAPFHYGRWVQVRNRWAWAPGRRADRLVWAPALVGWVGGSDWNVTFRDRSRHPAWGWYPLSWHDRYVPGYRAPDSHLRWLNEHVRPDPRRPRDYRPNGLTVVPQDRFGRTGRVDVPRAPIATVPPVLVHNVTAGAPPAPPTLPNRPRRDERPDRADRDHDRDRDQRADRDHRGDWNRGRIDSARVERDGFVRQRPPGLIPPAGPATGQAPGLVPMPAPVQPQPVVSPTPHLPPQPLTTVTSPPPRQAPPLNSANPTPQQTVPEAFPARPERWRRDGNHDRGNERGDRMDRDERREQLEEWRRNRRPVVTAAPQPAPVPVQSVQPAAPAATAPAAPAPAPVAMPAMPAPRVERPEVRPESRPDGRPERPQRDWGNREPAMPARSAPPPMPAAPAPAPARPAMPAPQPVMAALRPSVPPSPPPQPSQVREEKRQHTDERGRHQQER